MARLAPPSGVWGGLLGQHDHATGNSLDGTHTLDSGAAGLVVGGDIYAGKHLYSGLAVSFGHSTLALGDAAGQGRADAFQIGTYNLVQFTPRFYNSLSAAFSWNKLQTDRSLAVGGTDQLTAKFNAFDFGARYEAGLHTGWITPCIAVQPEILHAPSYSETATSGSAEFALSYAGHNAIDTRLEIGATQSGTFPLAPGWTMKLTDRLAWAYNVSDGQTARAGFQNLADS